MKEVSVGINLSKRRSNRLNKTPPKYYTSEKIIGDKKKSKKLKKLKIAEIDKNNKNQNNDELHQTSSSRDSDGFLVPIPINKKNYILNEIEIVKNGDDFANQIQRSKLLNGNELDSFALFDEDGRIQNLSMKRMSNKSGENAFLKRNKRIYKKIEADDESDEEGVEDDEYEATPLHRRRTKFLKSTNQNKQILKRNTIQRKTSNSFFLDKNYFELDDINLNETMKEHSNINKTSTNTSKIDGGNHSKVFVLLQKNKLDLNHFAVSWTKFYLGNEANNLHAIRLLVNLVCEACGMSKSLFSITSFEEETSKPIEIFEERIDVEGDTKLQGYPFSGKGIYKLFNEKLCNFFKEFVIVLGHETLFTHKVFEVIFEKWVFQMSCIRMRRLRHCAASIGFYVIDGLMEVFLSTNGSELKFRKQLNAEISKLTQEEVMKNHLVAELMAQIKRMRASMAAAKELFNKQYTVMFANKIRDVSPEIRIELLQAMRRWLKLLPAWVLDKAYAKYIAWALCDREAEVRVTSLLVFQDIIEVLQNPQKDELMSKCVKEFVNYCKTRVIQMRFDVSTEVQSVAVQSIHKMTKFEFIKSDEIECILDAFWRSSNQQTCKTFAEIINENMLSSNIFRSEAPYFVDELVDTKKSTASKSFQISNKLSEEIGLQQKELQIVLNFIHSTIPSVSNDASSQPVKLYRLTPRVVDSFWDHAPCIRNVRMILETFSIGEADSAPLQLLHRQLRTPLLYICERSLAILAENAKESEKVKRESTLEKQRLKKQLHSSIQYTLEHSITLINLHKSDPEHMRLILSIIGVALSEYHSFTIHFDFTNLSNELLRLTREHDSPTVYKSSIKSLSLLLECLKGTEPFIKTIKGLNDLLALDVYEFWKLYDIEYSKIVEATNESPNTQRADELRKHEGRVASAIQKYVHFHAMMPSEWEVDVKVIEICAVAIKNRINCFHDASELNQENADKSNIHTSNNLKSPSVSIVLNACDLLLTSFEKLVHQLLSLRKEISRLQQNLCSTKTTGGTEAAVKSVMDTDSMKIESNLKSTIHEVTEALVRGQDLFQRMRNLFIGLLEVEENTICNFGVFLNVMSMAQLTTVLFTEEELDTSGKAADFAFTEIDHQSLFNTLNGFLRSVETSDNVVDDRYIWVYSETFYPLSPLICCSPVLDMAKDNFRENLLEDEFGKNAQLLHIAITACQFVVNSNNMSLWQSNLGTLILIQINTNQPRITTQANAFMQLLKKRDIDKFFQLILRSIVVLHSALLSNDISLEEVMSFCTAISYRLGISLPLKMKISLCKFVYDAFVYSLIEPEYERLLEYLYPIAARRFLTKQEVGFLEKQLQKEAESRSIQYSKSAAKKLIGLFLKKPEKADVDPTQQTDGDVLGDTREEEAPTFEKINQVNRAAITVSSVPPLRMSSTSSISDVDSSSSVVAENIIEKTVVQNTSEFDAYNKVDVQTIQVNPTNDREAVDEGVVLPSTNKKNVFDTSELSAIFSVNDESINETSEYQQNEDISPSDAGPSVLLSHPKSTALHNSGFTTYTVESKAFSLDFEFSDKNLLSPDVDVLSMSSPNFGNNLLISPTAVVGDAAPLFDESAFSQTHSNTNGAAHEGFSPSNSDSSNPATLLTSDIHKDGRIFDELNDEAAMQKFDEDVLSDTTSFADDLMKF